MLSVVFLIVLISLLLFLLLHFHHFYFSCAFVLFYCLHLYSLIISLSVICKTLTIATHLCCFRELIWGWLMVIQYGQTWNIWSFGFPELLLIDNGAQFIKESPSRWVEWNIFILLHKWINGNICAKHETGPEGFTRTRLSSQVTE